MPLVPGLRETQEQGRIAVRVAMKLFEHRSIRKFGEIGGIEQVACFVKIERFQMDVSVALGMRAPSSCASWQASEGPGLFHPR